MMETNKTHNTIIKVKGIPISIANKNIHAYKAMNMMDIDEDAVIIYIEAFFPHTTIENIIKTKTASELSKIVNTSIVSDVCECCGENFYRNII